MKKDYTTKDITASSTSSIEEALSKAVEQVKPGEVTEQPKELSTRVKILLARKKNQQRKKRQHIPKALR